MNKKFILPLLFILIIIFLVFIRPGNTAGETTGETSNGSLLGIGNDLKAPTSPFTNISRFGQEPAPGVSSIQVSQQPSLSTTQVSQQPGLSTTQLGVSTTQPGVITTQFGLSQVLKYINGKKVTLTNNTIDPKKCLESGQKTLNELIENMIFVQLYTDYAKNNNINIDNVAKVYNATSLSDTERLINTLSTNEKNYLTMFVFGYIAVFGSDFQKCLKELKGNYFIWSANILLNTDLINGIPKTGAGWDQFNIQFANVTSDTILVVTPTFSKLPKPIKSVILKFRGKGENSKVVVNLVGKDNSGNPLPETQISTSFFDDPGDFHYKFYPLSLKYPVTVDSLNIVLTCRPGSSAAIDDAVILFVYQ